MNCSLLLLEVRNSFQHLLDLSLIHISPNSQHYLTLRQPHDFMPYLPLDQSLFLLLTVESTSSRLYHIMHVFYNTDCPSLGHHFSHSERYTDFSLLFLPQSSPTVVKNVQDFWLQERRLNNLNQSCIVFIFTVHQ